MLMKIEARGNEDRTSAFSATIADRWTAVNLPNAGLVWGRNGPKIFFLSSSCQPRFTEMCISDKQVFRPTAALKAMPIN
jgi:hypothetical protein